ncbi:alpha/beta fold hydrolase [Jiangella mangrovi]|uniref:Pimeloyl-ACP methyl ester carboxylesterase n=1 Tax=Jiangella mangrovi TaxID=1524084 RepID=A0A7W9GRZ0_9ACTN|nr:alpha/beta hydrolase [Jiangella mangrovi]MBB5788945.1 pimeloyl-ACP methyl ester carboxylesterase [Jiangella mangrovi]
MHTTSSPDGTTLAYDRTGAGPVLVVVGGAFGTRDHPSVTGLAEHLSAHATVVAYDRRGRGDSTDTSPYAVEREIEDLAAVIEATGGRAHVYGLSSGAALAARAAAAGLPIDRLVLHEPPYDVDGARPPLAPGFSEQVAALVADGRNGDAVDYFMTQGMGLPAEMVASMRPTPVWAGLEALAPTLVYDNAVMGDNTVPVDALRRIAQPVLVLQGELSPDWFHRAAAATAAACPDAQLHELPGQSHFAPDDAAVAAVVAEFLHP